jgi:hypothetical protein
MKTFGWNLEMMGATADQINSPTTDLAWKTG